MNPVNILITGQVDHGKSTLIGRLMHECGQMPDGAKEKLEQITNEYGQDNIEWAFALDSLELERQQGITLDASRVWLKRGDKELVLIDVPGHHELLGNMLTGASDAEATLVLVDAKEGVTKQTRLHAKLIQLLAIEQVVIVVTKMDMVEYDAATFEKHSAEAIALFPDMKVSAVPVSAKTGDNLTELSPHMPWYQGAPLLHHLDAFIPADNRLADKPFRLSVQDVVKQGDKRIITGKVASGKPYVGMPILACPSGSAAEIKEFVSWGEDGEKTSAVAGESVGLCLSQPIFSRRGEVISVAETLPYFLHKCRANVIWLGETAMQFEQQYTVRLGTQARSITISSEHNPLMRHELGECTLNSRELMAVDEVRNCPGISRFVIEDAEHRVVAAGVMLPDAADDQKALRLTRKSDNISPYGQPVTTERFEQRAGHQGAIFWFSGLSGAGKSTLAVEMQKLLFDRGRQVVILDGDNLRSGLTRDLGFSAEDRCENIRRAAEVARLFAMHGHIVMTAFITPTEADRKQASAICGRYMNHVYVDADLSLCEERDTKGLYEKARAGEIKDFTGISAPFDVPDSADVVIDTSKPLDVCVEELADFIEQKVKL